MSCRQDGFRLVDGFRIVAQAGDPERQLVLAPAEREPPAERDRRLTQERRNTRSFEAEEDAWLCRSG